MFKTLNSLKSSVQFVLSTGMVLILVQFVLQWMFQDICLGALKERDIEAKLKQVITDWEVVNLQFANFKTRGELLLKGAETQEINGMIEESLMVMNSLAANR